jgi:gas vesicle protein
MLIMNGKVVVGILSGVIAGILIGILVAPDKGYETRHSIARKGEELSEGIKVKIHQLGEFISEKLDGTKGVYKHFIRLNNTT